MNRTLLCGKVVPVVVSLRKTFLSPSVVAITIANKYRVTYEILSFNYAIIHAISPMIYIFFLYTTDIFRTWKHFLRVNVTFYDAANVIHDVITTDPIPYTAKFMFDGVGNNKTQQIRRWKINRIRIQCCNISKISNSVGRNDNIRALNIRILFQPR